MCACAVSEECVGIPEERQHVADEGREYHPEIHFKVRGND